MAFSFGERAGGKSSLTQEQILRYNADPDAFAARYFGFATADEYREWIEWKGKRCAPG